MAFVKRGSEIWRDLKVSLNPLLGVWNPVKSEIREWALEVETQLLALGASAGFDPSFLSNLLNRLTVIEPSAKRADGLRQQKRSVSRLVTGTDKLSLVGNTYGPVTTFSWTVGIAVARAVANPKSVTFWIAGLSALDAITVRIVSRPGTLGNGSATPGIFLWPGAYSGDATLYTGTSRVADLTAEPNNDVPTPIALPIDPGPMEPGTVYFAVISAKTAAGAPAAIAIARGRTRINDAIDPLWKSGLFQASDGNVVAPTDNGMLAYALHEALYVEGYRTGTDSRELVSSAEPIARLQYTLNGDVFTIALPEIEISNHPNPIRISEYGGVAGCARPAITSATGRPATLTYGGAFELDHQYVDGVVVRQGGSTLSEGVDYSINRVTGMLGGLKNIAPIAVTLDYTWAPHRYDLLVADPVRGTLLKVDGTPRIRDPNQYVPVVTGFPVVARLYVTRNRVEVLSTHEWAGFVRRGREGEYADWIAYNRSCLQATFALLNAGDPVRLGGYGDSITAVGGGNDYYNANGVRDVLSFFQSRYPADTLASIPKFDGPAGAGQHVHIGWNWVLKAALERRYGALVEYRNWGIPGTTSYADTVAGIGPNGRYPQRLSAYLADRCDLTVLGFGMNELGSEGVTTHDNTLAMIQAIRAQGGEVIVVTPPRPNAAAGWVIDDWWLRITRSLIRAARAGGAAYCDLSAISGPGNEGAIGFSAAAMCDQNVSNHPGPAEYAQYGAYLAETFVR